MLRHKIFSNPTHHLTLDTALASLNKQYGHIKKDSLQSAEKVRDTIFDIANSLADNPDIYPLDKYRKNNKGDIRAFEKYSLRVAYQVTKT